MNKLQLAYLLFAIIVALSCSHDEPAAVAPENAVKPPAEATTQAEQRHTHSTVYAPAPYEGNATLKERIATADMIALVEMLSVQAVVEELEPNASQGDTTPAREYAGALKFTFDVREYLKSGDSSPSRLKAIVGSLDQFDTQVEAQAVADRMLLERDSQWDTHAAIVFLLNESDQFPGTQSNDLYFMSVWDFTFGLGDVYSLASERNKIWLPSTTPSNAQITGELRFYTDVPEQPSQPAGVAGYGASARTSGSSGSSGPTITMSALKAEIASIDSVTSGQSEAYKLCVARMYLRERETANRLAQQGNADKYEPTKTAEIGSGLAAGTVVFDETLEGKITDTWKSRTWFEGEHADLFTIGDVTSELPASYTLRNSFYAHGGKFLIEGKRVIRPLETVRPTPSDVYNLTWNFQQAMFVPCNDTDAIYRFPTTITVTAPAGTLHEAFFDPVTDGSAIAADASNGILKPASFTDANNASATIQRIEWASGTVKVKVSPHTGLTGQTLDFIELDGSVSLSLNVAAATVDAASNTLSWSVSSQPWHDGDKLMLRIVVAVP